MSLGSTSVVWLKSGLSHLNESPSCAKTVRLTATVAHVKKGNKRSARRARSFSALLNLNVRSLTPGGSSRTPNLPSERPQTDIVSGGRKALFVCRVPDLSNAVFYAVARLITYELCVSLPLLEEEPLLSS
jgi:hypothetical protein